MSGPPAQNGVPAGGTGFSEEGADADGIYSVSPPSYYDATGPNFADLFTVSQTRSAPVRIIVNSFFLK